MVCNVTGQIFEIIRLLEEDNKKPKDYGNGIPLYQAEVQFLETIARYPDENVSALSDRLGITKGAVTQMVRKLCEKGLIETENREGNRKEKYFVLTQHGRCALKGHQQFHEEANRRLCAFIGSLNKEETDTVFRFLAHLKECVPFCEFLCECKKKEDNPNESAIAACARIARRA